MKAIKFTIKTETLGRDLAHMRHFQETSHSNKYGFHGPSKKEQRRKERRESKQAIKRLLFEY